MNFRHLLSPATIEINRLLREFLDLVMVENFILQSINPK